LNAAPCPIFVINLDRSVARLENATRQLHGAGLEFERIAAIDGRALPEAELSRLCPDNSRLFFAPLTPGEVGCWLSHARALRTMIDRGLPRCVVFEDDFELRPGFARCLGELLALGDRLPDAVKLFGSRAHGEVLAALPGGDLVVRSNSPPICSTCTLWTERGAQKLLRASTQLRRPIDVDIKHWWELDLDVAWVSPPVVVDSQEHMRSSTIGDRRVTGAGGRVAQLRYRWTYAIERHWRCMRGRGFAGWLRSLRRVSPAARRMP
jgi:glycosyl transferase family 25